METEILWFGIPAAAVVLGIVQVLKNLIPERLIPAVSLVIGIAMSCIVSQAFNAQTILVGLSLGFMASGIWSGVKKTALDK
jgi:hypothetical protein